MRLPVRKRYAVAALACAVGLIGALVVIALKLDRIVPGASRDGNADVLLGGRSFKIAGDAVRPLSLGSSAPIDIEFTNPADSPLLVTRLQVHVRSVEGPNADGRRPCSRLDFAVRQVGPRFAVTVPARSTRSLSGLDVPPEEWPLVRMINRPVNQDACKGASITLGYVGSGRLRR